MEELEYLIRVLNHRKADYEKWLNHYNAASQQYAETKGKIYGINFALGEIYNLINNQEQ